VVHKYCLLVIFGYHNGVCDVWGNPVERLKPEVRNWGWKRTLASHIFGHLARMDAGHYEDDPCLGGEDSDETEHDDEGDRVEHRVSKQEWLMVKVHDADFELAQLQGYAQDEVSGRPGLFHDHIAGDTLH
jgi:hypothetical protein